MTKQLQFRRGTTTENNAFTGAVGEVVVDTDKHTVRVHDGNTAGGYEIAKQVDLNTINSSCVHIAGTEDISGHKNFTTTISRKVSNVTRGLAPSQDTYSDINYVDTTGQWLGGLEHCVKTDKSSSISLILSDSVDSSTNTKASIKISENTDKDTNIALNADTITAKTPDSGNNSTQVSTTAFVQDAISTLLSTLYPIGALYIGTNAVCPLKDLIPGSKWSLISDDRVLQCSSALHTAGSTIAAGLPNITGSMVNDGSNDEGPLPGKAAASGAFAVYRAGNNNGASGGSPTGAYNYDFDASRVNSIYGNSTTVQPPAYVVNVWRRTA